MGNHIPYPGQHRKITSVMLARAFQLGEAASGDLRFVPPPPRLRS
jgi:hypothetical protein